MQKAYFAQRGKEIKQTPSFDGVCYNQFMIIDSHTHIALHKGEIRTTFQESLNLLLKEMKESKTDHALILPFFKRRDGQEQCAPLVVETLKLTEGLKNISVIGTIDVLNYQKADLDILEELLRKKTIVGIKLYPGYQHFYPSDKIAEPIYKLCQKYDVPVIFHSGDTLTTCYSQAKVQYSHPLHIDSVATDFPDLKIIIAHLGNPWLVDCAELLYKGKNVYADISGLVVEDRALKGRYGKMMKKKIEELMIYASPRKLLYGTDWPLATMKTYIKFTKSLGIPKGDLEYVFSKNAVNLFKIAA